MTVRVIHTAGLGDYDYGAVIQLEDRRARRLMLVGYVEEVKDQQPSEEERHGRTKHRSRV